MFPIRSVQGAVIGFGGRVLDRGEPKYLNSPETPVFSKGRELYGLFEARTAIRQRGYALVVEGYMDVVALAQAGFDNAVATLGTACTAEHVQKLVRFSDAVVFSFDGDAAGRRAAGRALEASLPHATDTRSFRFLFLPAEHDPDSFVREHGAEAFEGPSPMRCRCRARSSRRAAEASTSRPPRAAPVSSPTRARSGRPCPKACSTPAARRVRFARCLTGRRAGRRLARRDAAARRATARRAPRRRRGQGARSSRRCGSRPTASPGCCCSRAPGGTAWRRRPCPAVRPARLARRAVPLHRPRGAEHGAQPWAALARAPRRRALGGAALTLIDGEDPAIEPLADDLPHSMASCALRATSAPRCASSAGFDPATPGTRCIIQGFRDRGDVTAAPPGPGHPLNEGQSPKATFTRKGCRPRNGISTHPRSRRQSPRIGPPGV